MYNAGMTPMMALSQRASNRMTPQQMWTQARPQLHTNIGWGVVAADALKDQPDLHPELHRIVSLASDATTESIGKAFDALAAWFSTQPVEEVALGLSIWACQTQVEPYTVASLVRHTPLAWRWDVALAMQSDTSGYARPDNHTLLNVLNAERLAQEVSKDQHWEPSMLSNMFGS